MTDAIGRLRSVVLDCPDPQSLAPFWQTVLGFVHHHGDADWVSIADRADPSRRLSFQRVADYQPATWPTGVRPQHLHLDVQVDDLDAADEQVVAAGATRLGGPVEEEGGTFRVYADPVGHPFCLVRTDNL